MPNVMEHNHAPKETTQKKQDHACALDNGEGGGVSPGGMACRQCRSSPWKWRLVLLPIQDAPVGRVREIPTEALRLERASFFTVKVRMASQSVLSPRSVLGGMQG